jgi:agmatinase
MKPGPFSHRNFAGIREPYSLFEKARIVVIPVPYDSTVDWHGGQREGPRAIIDASQLLEFYDQELDREIFRTGIHTLPELQPAIDSPARMVSRVEREVGWVLDHGKFPVLLGGEHSITVGAVRALVGRYPDISVLQMDAHADLRHSYLGSRYSNACTARRLMELCPVVGVGIRSLSLEEQQYVKTKGLRNFAPGEIAIEEVLSALSAQVYITIDLDVLDPAIMSAVGTPEPGGMGWSDALALLKAVAGSKEVVGFDLVELCPGQGPAACAFTAAKLGYKLIGYVTERNR